MITNIKTRRSTQQRQVILKTLQELGTHPSAAEIYNIVRKKLSNISLGTVYRNLELLAEIGEIKKIKSTGSSSRFDASTTNHYHIICTRCGKVEDINIPFTAEFIREAQKLTKFDVNSYSLNFTGLCPKCKLNKS